MAGVIVRNNHYKELQEGLNAVFGITYVRQPEVWRSMFDIENSNKAFEEEVLNSDFGLVPEKGEGSAVQYDSAADGWIARYNHKTYAMAFAITEEAEEDGLYGSLGARYSKAMAVSFQETKNVNGAFVYNQAFSTSYIGGDGKSLLATDHPLFGGGTLSNKLAVPADLAEQSLEDAKIQIGRWTDERGKFQIIQIDKLILPTDLEFIAERLTKSPYRPGTGDNDVNAIKSTGAYGSGYMCTPYLTDTDAWFVRTNCPDGLKHMVRVKLKRGLEGDFETGSVRYKARERYSFGWSNWRALFGSEGG